MPLLYSLARPRAPVMPTKGRTAGPLMTTGMIFPGNATANSNIQILFNGGNLLSRTAHTAIWRVLSTQQNGYYAEAWHTELGNDWTDHVDHTYDYGTHPFPCDGSFNGSGQATGGTGDSGSVHYAEIAGVTGAVDTIKDVTGVALLSSMGTWITRARVCFVSGSNLVHRFWPDISQPTHYIEVTITVASLNSPASPAFLFGCSPWRADHPASGQSDETISGALRGLKLFSSGGLSITDIQNEDASGQNAPVTANGIASVWYMNINPTPTDITDKSGSGHNPSFVNANRPTLYTG